MPTSPDTLLRMIRRVPLPPVRVPTILGVDDWALRKGRTYGTLMVDLERHGVIDMLPARSTPILASWLRCHPGVELITRDRSSEFARAISQAAPRTIQVADRWRLLLNGRQMMERWLVMAHPRLRRLAPVPHRRPVPTHRLTSFPRTRVAVQSRDESRARRLASYESVHLRQRAGHSLQRISQELGLSIPTVLKYASAELFPERSAPGPGPSLIDPFLEYLTRRLSEGCENGCALWREIRARGYSGSTHQVHHWLQERRTVAAKNRPRPDSGGDWWARGALARDLATPKQLAGYAPSLLLRALLTTSRSWNIYGRMPKRPA